MRAWKRLLTSLTTSVLVAVGAGAQTSDLIISEYIEGTSNNKAIEIYNGTGAAVTLTNYTLDRVTNGGASSTATINLDTFGSIADGDVLVIANGSASFGAFDTQVDGTSGSISHNGDDAYQLKNNGVVIDFFGRTDGDPGTEWNDGTTGTINITLRRRASICAGNTAGFNPLTLISSEWQSFATDTFDGLGSHTASCAAEGEGEGEGASGGDPVPANGLLITEVVVTPTEGEFIETCLASI